MKAAYCLAGLFVAVVPWRAQGGESPEPAPEAVSLLLMEVERPPGAPAPGQTVWDLVERAAYRTRKARRILEDAEAWSTGFDRPAEEWTRAKERLDRLEKVYHQSLWPGLNALADSIIRIRGVAVSADVQLQEREIHAKTTLPDGPKGAFSIDPNPESLAGLRLWRETAEAYSIQAEELLERGLKALKKRPRYDPPSAVDYLHDIITEAESAVEEAASKSFDLAREQAALTRKNGPFWDAIVALESYGGRDGKGPYREKDRIKMIRKATDAKRTMVVLEYTAAARVEEARTLRYLLDRFGRL